MPFCRIKLYTLHKYNTKLLKPHSKEIIPCSVAPSPEALVCELCLQVNKFRALDMIEDARLVRWKGTLTGAGRQVDRTSKQHLQSRVPPSEG